jgi:hypothetical protein
MYVSNKYGTRPDVRDEFHTTYKNKLFTYEIMSHLFSTPKSPEGDFPHLQAFMMFTAEAPLGVWGEILRLQVTVFCLSKFLTKYYLITLGSHEKVCLLLHKKKLPSTRFRVKGSFFSFYERSYFAIFSFFFLASHTCIS